ncbi:MAG TPA: IclR family transcriptional regulator [Bacillota bacterium]|jgi:IclR family acetate operon transcriptional repressor
MKASDSPRVRSVSRALAILEVMAREESPMGLVAISRLVDLDPTTTHRLLHTMDAHGFVTQNTDGRYSLGIRVFQIGNSVTYVSMLRQVTRPFLQTLMERTGETANLAIKDGAEAAYIEQVTGTHFLRTFSEVGRGVPLHGTAVGKAILMGVKDEEIRQMAAGGLKRYTPNTITAVDPLLADIRSCREQGYAVDTEEYEPGARCLGAPIIGPDGKIFCAISVSGPITRMSVERVRALVPVITKSAAEIAQALRFASPART